MEKISKILPLISLLFMALGLFYNIYIYSSFGIDITEYIDLGEVVLLFLPSFFSFIYFAVISIVASHLLTGNLFWEFQQFANSNHPFNFMVRKVDENFVVVKKVILISSLAIFFVIPIVRMIFPRNSQLTEIIILSTLGMLLIFLPFYLGWLKYEINRKGQFELPYNVLKILFLLVSITFIVWYSGENKVYRILNGNPKQVTITSETGDVIVSDSSLIFIGKSKKYAFFYSKKSVSTFVYPLDKVRSLEIKLSRREEFLLK